MEAGPTPYIDIELVNILLKNFPLNFLFIYFLRGRGLALLVHSDYSPKRGRPNS